MTLAEFTSKELILPQLTRTDVPGILQELSQALHQAQRVPELLPFYNAALNREYLANTAMDYGIAFPHARLAGLSRVSFSLGRIPEGIQWGAKSGTTVRLIFLFAVPATDATAYLAVLSGLARLGKDTQLLTDLVNAPNAEAILDLLRRIPLRCANPSLIKTA